MSHTVEVLCRPEAAIGLSLAGLQPIAVNDPVTGAARLLALVGESSVGVILVEDWLHEALPADTHRSLSRRPLPMIVPFPGPTWAAPETVAHEYIVELLRQAIGYRVRLT